jgi:hypothetical protein
LDYITYGRRNIWDDIGCFQYGYQWKEGARQILSTAKTTFFPAVIFCTLLQTVMGIVMGASGQIVSFALLAAGSANQHHPMQLLLASFRQKDG